MAKKSTSAAVANLIALAAKKTGWSIAKLNRHLGKGENTLHRWRTGKMENFDLAALIEMCRLAEVSMDDAFGAHHKVTAQAELDISTTNDPALEQRVAQLEADNQAIKPLVQIVDGFAALIAGHMAAAMGQEEVSSIGATSPANSRIMKTIKQAQESAAGVKQRADDVEQDQIREEA